MVNHNRPEVWLRGPLPEVPALLQPVAHTLLQVREEIIALLPYFPEHLLWQQPAGVASAGFHLQHLTGVLDRLFTYARGESLTSIQLATLATEGNPTPPAPTATELVQQFNLKVEQAIEQLKNTNPETLTQAREVGRAKLPSTVLGLLVHAAEHTTRHYGQLLVTVRVQMNV